MPTDTYLDARSYRAQQGKKPLNPMGGAGDPDAIDNSVNGITSRIMGTPMPGTPPPAQPARASMAIPPAQPSARVAAMQMSPPTPQPQDDAVPDASQQPPIGPSPADMLTGGQTPSQVRGNARLAEIAFRNQHQANAWASHDAKMRGDTAAQQALDDQNFHLRGEINRAHNAGLDFIQPMDPNAPVMSSARVAASRMAMQQQNSQSLDDRGETGPAKPIDFAPYSESDAINRQRAAAGAYNTRATATNEAADQARGINAYRERTGVEEAVANRDARMAALKMQAAQAKTGQLIAEGEQQPAVLAAHSKARIDAIRAGGGVTQANRETNALAAGPDIGIASGRIESAAKSAQTLGEGWFWGSDKNIAEAAQHADTIEGAANAIEGIQDPEQRRILANQFVDKIGPGTNPEARGFWQKHLTESSAMYPHYKRAQAAIDRIRKLARGGK